MKKFSAWLLVAMTSVLILMGFVYTPFSILWFFFYALVMLIIIKTENTYFNKGFFIIYWGAAIAVIGKRYIDGMPETGSVAESFEVVNTLYQVMLMASSGAGGGLISHYIINKEKK